jgi:hypothetical protein
VANLNRNTTWYGVFELAECERQYSGQLVVIYSKCQKLFAKNQTEGTGIKICRFWTLIRTVGIFSIGKLFK